MLLKNNQKSTRTNESSLIKKFYNSILEYVKPTMRNNLLWIDSYQCILWKSHGKKFQTVICLFDLANDTYKSISWNSIRFSVEFFQNNLQNVDFLHICSYFSIWFMVCTIEFIEFLWIQWNMWYIKFQMHILIVSKECRFNTL